MIRLIPRHFSNSTRYAAFSTGSCDDMGTRFNRMHSEAFSVAPMMDYTDRHQRYLFRLLSKRAVLYTEMVTANALVHMPHPMRVLENFPEDISDIGSIDGMMQNEPLVLQLGGSSPKLMAKSAIIAKACGFQRININCGCPSPRVAGAGQFGASLMQSPDLVRDMCSAVNDIMGESSTTVKMRIGIGTGKEDADADEQCYQDLCRFVEIVSNDGVGGAVDNRVVDHFIVHARKAILGARITPSENRRIPPLRYDLVHRLCEDFPHLAFTLNGGLENISMCVQQFDISGNAQLRTELIGLGTQRHSDVSALCTTPKNDFSSITSRAHNSGMDFPSPASSSTSLAGVMVGRACVERPYSFATVDTTFYGAETNPSQCRAQVLQHYAAYANLVEKKYGLRTRRTLTKPLLGLFWNEAGGRIFRSEIDQLILHGRTTGYGALSIGDIILKSAESLSIETLNMSPQQWQNAMMNDYQGKGRPQTC